METDVYDQAGGDLKLPELQFIDVLIARKVVDECFSCGSSRSHHSTGCSPEGARAWHASTKRLHCVPVTPVSHRVLLWYPSTYLP